MSLLAIWNYLVTGVVGWCIFQLYDKFMASFVTAHPIANQSSKEPELVSAREREAGSITLPDTPSGPSRRNINTPARRQSAAPPPFTPSPSFKVHPPAGTECGASPPSSNTRRKSALRTKSTPSSSRRPSNSKQRSRSDSTVTTSSTSREGALATPDAPDHFDNNASNGSPTPSLDRCGKKVYKYIDAMFAVRLKHNNIFAEHDKSVESLSRSWNLLKYQKCQSGHNLERQLMSFETFHQRRRESTTEAPFKCLIDSFVRDWGVIVKPEVVFKGPWFATLDMKEDRITRGKPDFMHAEEFQTVKQRLGLDDESQLWQFLRPSVNAEHCLPNFFIEVKGPTGKSRDLYHQALYNGAVGARAMHKVRHYLRHDRLFDDVPRTVSITIDHSGHVIFYLSRARQLESLNPDVDPDSNVAYTLIRAGSFDMCKEADHLRWPRAIARAYEWAKKMRESVLSGIDDQFEDIPYIPKASYEHESRASSAGATQSAGEEPEGADETFDELEHALAAAGPGPPNNDSDNDDDGYETSPSRFMGYENEEEEGMDDEYDTTNTTVDTSALEAVAVLDAVKQMKVCAEPVSALAKPAEPIGAIAGLDAEATTVAPLAA